MHIAVPMAKKVLFLNWKDITHPSAGGAELLTNILAQHLATTYSVTYFTSTYPSATPTETLNGYTIIRRGNIYTTYIHAYIWWHLQKNKKDWKCIIDQVHGFPFFAPLYCKHPPVITLVMEVAGDLWNNTKPAILGIIGKLLERAWLFIYKKNTIVTISDSTKNQLLQRGIGARFISILPMFTNIHRKTIPQKLNPPTLLVIGRIAPVKQIEHAIAAYNLARVSFPTLILVIIGKTEPAYQEYKSFILKKIGNDPNILLIKNASEAKKQTWLEQAHILLMPSQKEGYGLVVLEAAACGTPAIGYRVSGIQDAIVHNETGILTDTATPPAMADAICKILADISLYTNIQQRAYEYANSHTQEITTTLFQKILITKLV